MKIFWETRHQEVLLRSRHDFSALEDVTSFMTTFNKFCLELIQHLATPLNNFKIQHLLKEKFPSSYSVNLEMAGKPVMVVPDPADFGSVFDQFPDHFIALESFINLVKGVGVQEHTLLNHLTKDRSSYYFKFNKQRLAADLLSTLALNKQGQKDIYFCLRNINDFVSYSDKTLLPDWNNIESLWREHGKTAKDHSELKRLIITYLEVLRTLR